MSLKNSAFGTRHSILLTGGGTGGHLAIVRAVKEELLRRGIRPFYVGSESGQDRQWFENEAGFAGKLFLPTHGVVNRQGADRLSSLLQIVKGAYRVRRYMKEHEISAVLSVGGFSAAPAAIAAVARGTPLFIHEQNAVSGRLNRLLKPFAKRFFSSYEAERIDYPVRSIFFETARVRRRVERIIFLGGSQGARAINDFALSVAPELKRRGIAIVHQTGKQEFERVARLYEAMKIEVDLFPFHAELHEKIAQADFAVTRAGASTLWELVANRLPALYVPYPYAAGDHQYFNAEFLVKRGVAWLARESALTPEVLWRALASDKEEVSIRLGEMIAPGGAHTLVERILTVR